MVLALYDSSNLKLHYNENEQKAFALDTWGAPCYECSPCKTPNQIDFTISNLILRDGYDGECIGSCWQETCAGKRTYIDVSAIEGTHRLTHGWSWHTPGQFTPCVWGAEITGNFGWYKSYVSWNVAGGSPCADCPEELMNLCHEGTYTYLRILCWITSDVITYRISMSENVEIAHTIFTSGIPRTITGGGCISDISNVTYHPGKNEAASSITVSITELAEQPQSASTCDYCRCTPEKIEVLPYVNYGYAPSPVWTEPSTCWSIFGAGFYTNLSLEQVFFEHWQHIILDQIAPCVWQYKDLAPAQSYGRLRQWISQADCGCHTGYDYGYIELDEYMEATFTVVDSETFHLTMLAKKTIGGREFTFKLIDDSLDCLGDLAYTKDVHIPGCTGCCGVLPIQPVQPIFWYYYITHSQETCQASCWLTKNIMVGIKRVT